jgi:predicted aspartyl protease
MEFTSARITISNPFEAHRSADADLLADTGALNTFVPRAVLEQIGIRRKFRRWFQSAGGQTIERDVGFALFSWKEHAVGGLVVFAEAEDMPVLGVAVLQSMGLEFDPVTRSLKLADPNQFSDTLPFRAGQLFL